MLINAILKRLVVVLGGFLPYLFGIAAIFMVGWLIWSSGYGHGANDTRILYETAAQKERERQDEVNRLVLEETNLKILELQRLLGERDETVRRLLSEADNDPDANRRSLSADSVRRINQAR